MDIALQDEKDDSNKPQFVRISVHNMTAYYAALKALATAELTGTTPSRVCLTTETIQTFGQAKDDRKVVILEKGQILSKQLRSSERENVLIVYYAKNNV